MVFRQYDYPESARLPVLTPDLYAGHCIRFTGFSSPFRKQHMTNSYWTDFSAIWYLIVRFLHSAVITSFLKHPLLKY